ERLLPEQRLTRLTIDLIRPVPHAGFKVVAALTREGRSVSTASGQIIDADGVVRATFNGMLMARFPEVQVPSHYSSIGTPEEAIPGGFAIEETAHGQTCFVHATEMKYPEGHSPSPGPTKLWMKTLPLLASEQASPFQRICPLADCGNAFGRNANPWDIVTFANADLSVVLHREPEGDWLGAHAVSYWESDGIGLADAQLFDRHGSVGRALQTLVLRPPNL
ncbi:MAG: thioesterase family protein, partial [Granulosicoccaceae bacterium]